MIILPATWGTGYKHGTLDQVGVHRKKWLPHASLQVVVSPPLQSLKSLQPPLYPGSFSHRDGRLGSSGCSSVTSTPSPFCSLKHCRSARSPKVAFIVAVHPTTTSKFPIPMEKHPASPAPTGGTKTTGHYNSTQDVNVGTNVNFSSCLPPLVETNEDMEKLLRYLAGDGSNFLDRSHCNNCLYFFISSDQRQTP